MSKKLDITNTIMTRIEREHIRMKPRWYFIVGSFAMLAGLIGLSILSMFLVNLTAFSLRTHGPMGSVRYQQLLSSFPWWIPVLIIVGLGAGIWMLKKYDFSYRKNFLLVILGFVAAIILSGIVADSLGINIFLSRQGPMRRFYQQMENQRVTPSNGQGQGRGQWK